MDLIPIITPPDWNPEKDFQEYEYRFGETENYFVDALNRVAGCYEELNDVLDAALRYFEKHDHRLTPVHPGTLTLTDKVYRLSIITTTRSDNYQYKDRFVSHLHACQWVDTERQRVMQGYYLGEEKTWLYPLAQVADFLACAACELEEAMRVEHDDYKQ